MRHQYKTTTLAPLIAFLVVSPLFLSTVLMGDWFGVGNSLAIVISILVRKALLWQRRTALHSVAVPPPSPTEALPMHNKPQDRKTNKVDTFTRQLHRLSSEPSPDEVVKMFVTRADGRMATIHAPRDILSTFIKRAPLPSPLLYRVTQWLGWTAFGAHIVVLGMSSLFTQIYTVVLLVLSTWAMCHDFAFDSGRENTATPRDAPLGSECISMHLTSRLVVRQLNPPETSSKGEGIDKRMIAYVRAGLSSKQEAMLKHWSMMPFEGVPWYEVYEQAKQKHARLQTAGNEKIVLSSSPTSNTSMSIAETLTPQSPSPVPTTSTQP
jgi:hypothetical protein